MIVERGLYLNKLIERKSNGSIKVITGIRRSGKSFLLFNLFKKHLLDNNVKEDHIIELNFDDFDNEEYRNPKIASPYLKGKIICCRLEHKTCFFPRLLAGQSLLQ